MRVIIWLLLLTWSQLSAQTQTDYQDKKTALVKRFEKRVPGKFGSFVKGVKTHLKTDKKVIALTFDACGGPRGNGYDEELIRYLRKEKIHATLFLTGQWIDSHPDVSSNLARDTLFEIENHGLQHRPCSISGQSRYGIKGTLNTGEVIDEIDLNAGKIFKLTKRRPLFFRPATATCDEACGEIASALNESIVHFDVLSGDAVGGTSAQVLIDNVLKKSHPGAIVIMHMNHPEWNGFEALKEIVPELVRRGYSFVRLDAFPLEENP